MQIKSAIQSKKKPIQILEMNNDIAVQCTIIDNDRPIFITFSHINEIIEDREQAIWSHKYLSKLGFNVLSFSSYKRITWYRSQEFQELLNDIAPFLKSEFPTRLGYGASMGGYALLAYASLLGLDRSLISAPISTLNRKAAGFEPRFSIYKEHIDWNGAFSDVDKATKTKNYILFDPLHTVDIQHVKRIPNRIEIKIPGSGHGHAIPILKELGMFDMVFWSFIADHFPYEEFARKIRARRQCQQYYKTLLRNPYYRTNKYRINIIEKNKNRATERKLNLMQTDVDAIRDASLNLENVEPKLAKKLIQIAYRARPNGPVIKSKFFSLAQGENCNLS